MSNNPEAFDYGGEDNNHSEDDEEEELQPSVGHRQVHRRIGKNGSGKEFV